MQGLVAGNSHSCALHFLSMVTQQVFPHNHPRRPGLPSTTRSNIFVILQWTRQLAVKCDFRVAFGLEDGKGRQILANGGHGVQWERDRRAIYKRHCEG